MIRPRWRPVRGRARVAAALGVALAAAPTGAQPRPGMPTPQVAAATAPLRILWIGNSYTYVNDLPRTLTALALAAGEDRVPAITAVLKGGQFLRGHLARPDLPALIAQGWDYVVLQEQSLAPLQQPDSLLAQGTRLGALAKAAGARVLLYVTWPRRDTPQLADSIAAVYGRLAAALEATPVPVGRAWGALRAESPASVLYLEDGSHPAPIGTYLAACVFYGVLYQKPATGLAPVAFTVRGNRYLPDSLPMAVRPVTLPAAEVAAAHRAADRALSRRP
ncbi:MAG: hypothetical protein RLZ32_425 [Gemmatimonadota bacterium]